LKRKDFLYLTGMGISASMLSRMTAMGSPVVPGTRMRDVDVTLKKRMADVALNAARAKGATYTDARIGRYLNQFVVTRDKNIENIVDTESYGVGIRVIANGCWGFAATNAVTSDGDGQNCCPCYSQRKANASNWRQAGELAPQKGYGEVSWKAPIVKSAFEVPMKEKVELLLSANDCKERRQLCKLGHCSFVNEQKYFASTDGSYIDQDIHRISPNFR
jgi:TldD protein